MVQAGFELKNEEFRPEYEDLKNHQTEKLIDKIEQAVGISHWKDRGSIITLSKGAARQNRKESTCIEKVPLVVASFKSRYIFPQCSTTAGCDWLGVGF